MNVSRLCPQSGCYLSIAQVMDSGSQTSATLSREGAADTHTIQHLERISHTCSDYEMNGVSSSQHIIESSIGNRRAPGARSKSDEFSIGTHGMAYAEAILPTTVTGTVLIAHVQTLLCSPTCPTSFIRRDGSHAPSTRKETLFILASARPQLPAHGDSSPGRRAPSWRERYSPCAPASPSLARSSSSV